MGTEGVPRIYIFGEDLASAYMCYEFIWLWRCIIKGLEKISKVFKRCIDIMVIMGDEHYKIKNLFK